MDKKLLSEADICTKYITPAIVTAGWDLKNQIRQEVYFTKGGVIVEGQKHRRGKSKKFRIINGSSFKRSF